MYTGKLIEADDIREEAQADARQYIVGNILA